MTRRGLTWNEILAFFGMAVFLSMCSVASLAITWSPPTKESLLLATGRFVTLQKGTFQPYEFETQGGQLIQLGCVPGIRVVDCLSPFANSPELKGIVTIGYMNARIPWWKFARVRWSNALVTVDADGTPILAYSTSSARIGRAYAFDRASKWMVPFLLLPFAAGCLFIATVAVVKKVKPKN